MNTLNGNLYIPSHCEATNNISSLIELNRNKLKEIVNKIYTAEKAKNVPCIFNNWANFYKGEFISNTILNVHSFKKLIE